MSGSQIDGVPLIYGPTAMKTLVGDMEVADQLSSEDQAGLAAHLLAGIPNCPLGPDDAELERREAEMNHVSATLLTHEQLRQAVEK